MGEDLHQSGPVEFITIYDHLEYNKYPIMLIINYLKIRLYDDSSIRQKLDIYTYVNPTYL